MRGRPPLPRAVKALQGTLRKHRDGYDEPRPTLRSLPCPGRLTGDARTEWKRVAPELFRLGLLSVLDGAILEGYCCAVATWRAAQAAIARDGLLLDTPNGYQQAHPGIAIAAGALKQMHVFAGDFGLTPVARARIAMPPVDREGNAAARLFLSKPAAPGVG